VIHGKVWQIGDRDECVKVIQKVVGMWTHLIGPADNTSFEYTGSWPDGDFGVNTGNAVRYFQRANGLYANGIVDLDTWKRINATLISEPVLLNATQLGYEKLGTNRYKCFDNLF
jgi:peptidoglycan hydrolase-like protein with peptidoglycan-binding domain